MHRCYPETMLTVEMIRRRLAEAAPDLISDAGQRAAVAMILHQPSPEAAAEILLIERAHREGDPWSGQMALPGGRRETGDPSLLHTARRETAEEVGLDVPSRSLLGQLDDQGGRRAGRPLDLVISTFVIESVTRGELTLNHEVESAFWVSLEELADPQRWVDYRYPLYPERTFPGVVAGDPERHVVWGLTYRILSRLFHALEIDFPEGP
jgi:8-oxo-dGTP pyrophosphatase MutT (NUDIX family)